MSVVTSFVLAGMAFARGEYLEVHPGYISAVEEERYTVAQEVVIVPPEKEEGPSLRDRIFYDELTREFRQKYEDKFGRTQAEQFTNVSSRYFEMDRQGFKNRTVEEESSEQQKFGNFMMKRLVEEHADKYMRSNPSVRPVYELKEKVSNMSMQVKPNYKIRVKYSLSSNDLDLSLQNPYDIDNRISYRGKDGAAVVLNYPITKTIQFKSDYLIEKSHWIVSGVKRLNARWSTSLTSSRNETEEKLLVGLNWSD